MRNFDLVHLALHTDEDADAVANRRLVLGEDGQAIAAAEGTAADHGGGISASEIQMSWKLDADLVTVSACSARQTGSWVEQMAGFGEAFLRAGAHSLLSSLWDVDDTATSLLMQRFYEDLAGAYRDERGGLTGQPMSKVRALHEARNWLRGYRDSQGRQPFANPVYWAAFTLVGDAGEE